MSYGIFVILLNIFKPNLGPVSEVQLNLLKHLHSNLYIKHGMFALLFSWFGINILRK